MPQGISSSGLGSLPVKTHTSETIIGLVDSNILVYLADSTNQAKHEKAKLFFVKVSKDPGMFVVSIQNLREFSSVFLAKKKIPLDVLREYLSLFDGSFSEVFCDSFDDLLLALSLAEGKKSHFWDFLLAATMLRHEVKLIYTENIKDFRIFREIKAVNPLK